MPDIRPETFDRLSRSVQRTTGVVADIFFDQRKKLYNAEVERQYSNATYGMNQVFDKFMTDLSGRAGEYERFMTDWTTTQQAAQESLGKQITLPEAKQKFDRQFQATEGRRRSQINDIQINSQIGVTTSEANAKIEDISSGTDPNGGLAVQIQSMRDSGMWRADQIQKVEENAFHRIEGNRYYAAADALAAGGTQQDVDAGVAFLADDKNTPEWDNQERNDKISEFKRIWASRLAGTERKRQEEGLNQVTDAYDILQRIREGDPNGEGDAYPDNWAAMQERWPDASPESLRGLLEAKESFDRQVIENAELATRTKGHDTSIFELNNLERSGKLTIADLNSHAKNLSVKENDHYADAIYDRELEEREDEEAEKAKDADNSAAALLTRYELGIVKHVDPRVFFNETGGFKFLERREHYADKAIGIAEDKKKAAEKDEVDLLGTDDHFYEWAIMNVVLNDNLSLAQATTELRGLQGPANGEPRISGDDVLALIQDAKSQREEPQNKIPLDVVNDYYLPLIENATGDERRSLVEKHADALRKTSKAIADDDVDAVDVAQNIITLDKEVKARNVTVNWLDKVTGFLSFGQFNAAEERARANQRELEEFREKFGTTGVEESFEVGPPVPGRPGLPPLPGERPGPEWQMAEQNGDPVWYNPGTKEIRQRGR